MSTFVERLQQEHKELTVKVNAPHCLNSRLNVLLDLTANREVFMNTYCDRCGKDCRLNRFSDFVMIGELTEIKSIYQTDDVKKVCSECGDEANKFINYYGKKKKKDLDGLREFLESGNYIFHA